MKARDAVRAILVTIAAGAFLAGAAAGISRLLRPAERAISSMAPADANPRADASAKPSALPDRGAFAGAERCGECHAKEHEGWKKDWHSRALSAAEPSLVVGDFHDAHFLGSSSEAWMRTDSMPGGVRPVMRTLGPDGAAADFAVDWVLGGKRMQDSATILPDGRWQVLPVYFHVTGKPAWVDYTEQKQGHLAPDHPFFWANFRRMANRECLDCHVSGLEVRYQRAGGRWTTRFSDAGVACESCHGPGARHAETQDPRDIVHPKKAAPEIGLALCGQCHGPRSPLFPMLDAAHRFRPGERYQDRYQTLVVVDGRTRSGDFFADGRPKTSSFEYTALIQSRCHLKGGATCLSCHSAPHATHDRDELPMELARDPIDAGCKGCHEAIVKRAREHTHHRAVEAQRCAACHMPPVVSGVLDKFADHALDVPVPENSIHHQVPNACNACHAHAKQSPAVMVRAIDRLWPGSAARRSRRIRLADAIDETTAERSEEALLAVIADDAEAPTLRGAAALLLAQRFGEAAAPALLPLLQATDVGLRTKASEALAFARAHRAADALARLIADPSLMVRHSAAVALATFGDPRGEQALRALALDAATEGLSQPHLMLGMTAARRGDLLAASAELERALELRPYASEVLVTLADVYAKRGELGLARARLEEALRFDPQQRAARERLRLMGPR